MDRKYEKFIGGPTKPTEERIYASISPQNVITINTNCYRLLGKPPAVYLYFSRADDMIAVEPVESYRLPSAFPVRERNQSGCKRINASPFCKHFGIRIDSTERFVSPEIRDGALHLKLTDTVTIQNLRRKK